MKKNEKLRKREKGEQRATNLTNGERERERSIKIRVSLEKKEV